MQQADDDLVAAAGVLRAVKGGDEACGEIHCHLVVAETGNGQHGHAVDVVHGAKYAAAGEVGGEVKAGQILVGALLAVAADTAHDEGRIALLQALVVEPGTLERLLAPVGYEDVAAAMSFSTTSRPASVLVFKVMNFLPVFSRV